MAGTRALPADLAEAVRGLTRGQRDRVRAVASALTQLDPDRAVQDVWATVMDAVDAQHGREALYLRGLAAEVWPALDYQHDLMTDDELED